VIATGTYEFWKLWLLFVGQDRRTDGNWHR